MRHYELFAEKVATHFTGQLVPVVAAYDKVTGAGDTYVNATLTAQLESMARYQAERASRSAAPRESAG